MVTNFRKTLKVFRKLERGHPEIFRLSQEWLQYNLTVQEAEEQYMVFDKRLGDKGVPFGFINHEWKALVAEMIGGDELWKFRSPEFNWMHFCGREGIALVRKGKIIGAIYTRVN